MSWLTIVPSPDIYERAVPGYAGFWRASPVCGPDGGMSWRRLFLVEFGVHPECLDIVTVFLRARPLVRFKLGEVGWIPIGAVLSDRRLPLAYVRSGGAEF